MFSNLKLMNQTTFNKMHLQNETSRVGKWAQQVSSQQKTSMSWVLVGKRRFPTGGNVMFLRCAAWQCMVDGNRGCMEDARESVWWVLVPLLKPKSLPLKMGRNPKKERIVSQPSIFGGENVSFRDGNSHSSFLQQ